ncbi:MAG: response regulator transcription factor, partial [Pseudonocardiaceae bacterium]
HGLAVCRALRAAGSSVDVIAVTAQRDLAAMRDALSLGVVYYLVKPFAFASLRDKLESYAEFRRRVARPGQVTSQDEVDDIWDQRRPRGLDRGLPKGINGETLRSITALLAGAAQGLSAAAAASALGMSRVTARRYLDFLAEGGIARREPRYGQVGRPEFWFYPIRPLPDSWGAEDGDGDDDLSPS